MTGLWIAAQTGPQARWRKTGEPIPVREAIAVADLSLLDAPVDRYELMPGFILAVRREGDGPRADGGQALPSAVDRTPENPFQTSPAGSPPCA